MFQNAVISLNSIGCPIAYIKEKDEVDDAGFPVLEMYVRSRCLIFSQIVPQLPENEFWAKQKIIAALEFASLALGILQIGGLPKILICAAKIS